MKKTIDVTWEEEGGFPVKEGITVQATTRIVEENFNGAAEWVHAEPGDVGEVVGVALDDGVPTVRFARTGTATAVFTHEIRPALTVLLGDLHNETKKQQEET